MFLPAVSRLRMPGSANDLVYICKPEDGRSNMNIVILYNVQYTYMNVLKFLATFLLGLSRIWFFLPNIRPDYPAYLAIQSGFFLLDNGYPVRRTLISSFRKRSVRYLIVDTFCKENAAPSKMFLFPPPLIINF